MSSQVSVQLIDLSKDISLLSRKQEDNHYLLQLFPLIPFAPFLIKLFTHDSYWIFRLFNNGHVLVLNFIGDLPYSVLKRADFWEQAWKELTQEIRNFSYNNYNLSSLVLQSIGSLEQLSVEEREIVRRMANESLLNTVFQPDVVVDYEEMARQDSSLLSNIDFILKAMKSGVILQGVDEFLLKSREFISKQIEVDPIHQDHEWKLQNKDLLIKSFEYGLPIYWIGDVEPHENDEEVVLKAVEMDNYIINEIPSKFTEDREFLKKAISLNGMNLVFFKGLFYSDLEELEMKAVENNSNCLKIVHPKYSTDLELIEKLIELNPFIIQHIPKVQSNTEFQSLLEKVGKVMLKQFKAMSQYEHKTEEIKCKDWKNLIRKMKSKPTSTELSYTLQEYLRFKIIKE